MRVLLVFLMLLAGCSPAAPPAPAVAPTVEEPPVIRVIANTIQVDRMKEDVAALGKTKRITAQQARELALLVSMADEAMQASRSAYLSSDLPKFERSLLISQAILQEVRSLIAAHEAEQKDLLAKRRRK